MERVRMPVCLAERGPPTMPSRFKKGDYLPRTFSREHVNINVKATFEFHIALELLPLLV